MTHRDPKLDKLIDKRVKVTFNSGKDEEGILGWCDNFMLTLIPPMRYFILLKDGNYCSFRKSQVKKVEVLK